MTNYSVNKKNADFVRFVLQYNLFRVYLYMMLILEVIGLDQRIETNVYDPYSFLALVKRSL